MRHLLGFSVLLLAIFDKAGGAQVCTSIEMKGTTIAANKGYEGIYKMRFNQFDFCVNDDESKEITYMQEDNSMHYLFNVDYSYKRSERWRFGYNDYVCQDVPGVVASQQYFYTKTPDLVQYSWLEWNETAANFFTNSKISVTCLEYGDDPLATTGISGEIIGGIIGGVAGVVILACIIIGCVAKKIEGKDKVRAETSNRPTTQVKDYYAKDLMATTQANKTKEHPGKSNIPILPGFVEQPKEKKPKLDVYICHRQESGSVLASLIRMHLESKKLTCYLDTQERMPGHFHEKMTKHISEVSSFLVVLSEGALDKCQGDTGNQDPVHVEIATALRRKKKIVPFIDVKKFKWPQTENLPEDMQELPLHNGIKWVAEYQSACLDKLVKFLKAKK